jgi:long-chain acyl-CoA synthetase
VLFLLSEDELRHVLTDSAAAFVVTTPEILPKVTAAAGTDSLRGIITVGEPPVASAATGGAATGGAADSGGIRLPFADLETAPEADLIDAEPSELAALLYTGGTTGRSKGVMISHDALSASAWAATATSYQESPGATCRR